MKAIILYSTFVLAVAVGVAVAQERRLDLKDGPAKLFPDGRIKYDESGRRVGAELCIVQWQKGRPVAVHPESIAVSKAVWPKLS